MVTWGWAKLSLRGAGLTHVVERSRVSQPCLLFHCTQGPCSGLVQLLGECQILPIMIFGASPEGAAEEQQMQILTWSVCGCGCGRHSLTSKGPSGFMSCAWFTFCVRWTNLDHSTDQVIDQHFHVGVERTRIHVVH